MKAILSLSLLVPLLVCGQNTPEVPRLSGIVNLPEFRRAVLELKQDCCGPRQLVLTEGESMWGTKLISISPAQRAVQVNVEGWDAPVVLSLPERSNAPPVFTPGIELVDASVYSVLELCGQFLGKTLLYWPNLPAGGISAKGPAEGKRQAAQLLQAALAEKQVAWVADGEKFVMIVPAHQIGSVKPHAPRPISTPGPGKAPDVVPPGTIAFHGVMMEQVYSIYADLVGTKLDRGAPRPVPTQPFIFLYTQSAISQEEAVYALDTLLGWQGIRMVRGQDGSVRPVRLDAK